LIAASRCGDATAYDTLYRRHAAAARNLARQLVRGQAEADDVVAETFAKILDLLRRGGGPEGAFRPYLLTAVRRAAYDRHRAERRQLVTDQMEAFDPGVPFADPAVADLERTMIARAFASLPQRWQAVLWHTEIEGARPAEVATLLGLTANGVAALAYRAREGLRQAYLQMHLSGAARAECRPVAAKLGAYVRGGLAKRDATMVARHLDQCADCRRIFAELGDVNVALKAVVAPVVLGPAAAAYLASAAGRGSAAGWVTARLARLGRVRHVAKGLHVAKGQHVAVVAASVATVGLVAAAVALGGHHGAAPGPVAAHRAPPPAAAPAPASVGNSAPILPAASRPQASQPTGSGAPGPGSPARRPGAGVPVVAHPAAAGPVPPSVLSQPNELQTPAQLPPVTLTRPAHRQPAPSPPAKPSAPAVPPSTPLPAPPPTAPVIAGAPAPDPQIVTPVNLAGGLPPSGTGIVGISVTNPGPAVLPVTANVSPLGVNLTLGL
jgi:RNA polymerase sigma factor (sigma-70 family)